MCICRGIFATSRQEDIFNRGTKRMITHTPTQLDLLAPGASAQATITQECVDILRVILLSAGIAKSIGVHYYYYYCSYYYYYYYSSQYYS